MDIKMKKEAFMLAGVQVRNIKSSKCPRVRDKLSQKASFDELEKPGNGKSFGICYKINKANNTSSS